MVIGSKVLVFRAKKKEKGSKIQDLSRGCSCIRSEAKLL